ncbi:ATP-binding protein [Sphingomonas sp. BK235]|uniref:sensor histidine kinase n=1 Tax=Sphingomonas sp. BK235 TaxID=2512131 RepID=UPI0010531D32|nr:ATP-binding protein [Sphingomonas sp. BK235]TCP33586.1 histidine kinase/DNA gyrase B/HSP90-like ATPase [Sphingomonas sp. BK235]
MGSDARFTAIALGWTALLAAAIAAGAWGLAHGGGAATLLVAAGGVALGLAGLLRHVHRTQIALARFVEEIRLGDATARMPRARGGSTARLGAALDTVMRTLQQGRAHDMAELRFLEALLDDVPIALLLIEGGQVRLGNKAARALFGGATEGDAARFAPFGAELGAILADTAGGAQRQQIVRLTLHGATQRALVRRASLARLGVTVGAVTVEPIQQTLDAVEVAAQAAIVRVLTHEILNSLTPIVSLAGTATVLLGEDPVELDEARLAVLTLARRAEATRRFVDSYREVARPMQPRRRRFAAAAFAQELARLFAADWLDHRLACEVEAGLLLDADPDLLGQAVINLLRNAAQASDRPDRRRVVLRIAATRDGAMIEVEDNGCGMPAAVARDMFLPFFTTKESGTGVGLHLVRQVVVAHDAQVDVVSTVDVGTTIRIAGPLG